MPLIIFFLLIVAIITVVVFLASVPFAIIGWAVTTVAELFGAFSVIGYWATAGYGLASIIVLAIAVALKMIIAK